MGDRIETGTFCVAAVLTNGNLLIKGFDPKMIKTEIDLLKITAAAVTGPAKQPLPTSSTPAIITINSLFL